MFRQPMTPLDYAILEVMAVIAGYDPEGWVLTSDITATLKLDPRWLDHLDWLVPLRLGMLLADGYITSQYYGPGPGVRHRILSKYRKEANG